MLTGYKKTFASTGIYQTTQRKRERKTAGESKREAEPRLSHSFDSQFTHRSQPGGRDFEEERSVARLKLKCQMLYFDFMEKRHFRGSDRPHATKHFPSFLKENRRHRFFH